MTNKLISVVRWRGFPHSDHFCQWHNGVFHDLRLNTFSSLRSKSSNHRHCLFDVHTTYSLSSWFSRNDLRRLTSSRRRKAQANCWYNCSSWQMASWTPTEWRSRSLFPTCLFRLCIFKRLRPESGDLARFFYVVNIKELAMTHWSSTCTYSADTRKQNLVTGLLRSSTALQVRVAAETFMAFLRCSKILFNSL